MAKPDPIVLTPAEMTPGARRRIDATNRNLRVLNPQGRDHEDYKESIARNPRLRYAAMRAHMEMAAQALSVGATQKMAAKYAGVSPRQIKKYYTDPEFRTRIEELRNILASKIKGKLLREMNRRTTGMNLKNMDLLDLLRVFDRVTSGGKGMSLHVDGDVNVNQYDTILQALFAPNARSNGGDFPVYGTDSLRLPGGDSPVD